MMKTAKQRLGLFAAACTLLFGLLPDLYAQAISNVADLQRIGNDPAYPLSGSYWLTQDIDATGTALWNDSGTGIGELEGFKPIGDIGGFDEETLSWTNGLPFTGVFDGNGFTIRGLTINRPDRLGVGLFSRLADSAAVRNLRLTETAVQGYYPVGGLVGLSFGTVIGCSSTGTVTGVAYVGGLAGRVEAGTLRRCHAAGDVSADLFSAGGLVGDLEAGTVSACYATAAVDGDTAVGGLAGSNFGLIDTCYAAGNVTGNSAEGGLVGEGFGSVSSSYWDVTASGQALSAGGEGRATAQMRQQATFVGWDFMAVWGIAENAGYPYLATGLTATVLFDAQGGTVVPGLLTVTVAEAYGVLPVPARTGYTFAGWWTAPGGAGSQVTNATAVTETVTHTLYALWVANTYTVTLDAQGGTVSPSSVNVTFGAAYGPLPVPELAGHTFSGWQATAGGSAFPVTAATVVTLSSDHTLTALFSRVAYLCPPADEPLADAGAYAGYFYRENPFADSTATAVYGTFTLTLKSLAGRLTAKAVLRQGSLTFTAPAWNRPDADGTRRAQLPSTRGGVTLDLFVRQDRIWGTLAGGLLGDETFALDGARLRFDDRDDVAAQAALDGYRGYYTVALPIAHAHSTGSAEAAPEGSGFLTFTVGNKGSVKFSGVLADGTRFTHSSRLLFFGDCGPEACVPFFTPLNARQGWAGGLLWITPDRRTVVTDRNLGWFVRWEKPGKGADGFSVLLDAVGGFYSTPPRAGGELSAQRRDERGALSLRKRCDEQSAGRSAG